MLYKPQENAHVTPMFVEYLQRDNGYNGPEQAVLIKNEGDNK